MTVSWVESCRGGVAAWEVDHVGHFTVAYYHQRIEDAGFAVLEGLGPGDLRGEGHDCVTTTATCGIWASGAAATSATC